MKEPMTDARRKQLYRIKKRKRRKQCIRVALRMAVLCFLVLFAVQKTADLLRVDDSDRMGDAEQKFIGMPMCGIWNAFTCQKIGLTQAIQYSD